MAVVRRAAIKKGKLVLFYFHFSFIALESESESHKKQELNAHFYVAVRSQLQRQNVSTCFWTEEGDWASQSGIWPTCNEMQKNIRWFNFIHLCCVPYGEVVSQILTYVAVRSWVTRRHRTARQTDIQTKRAQDVMRPAMWAGRITKSIARWRLAVLSDTDIAWYQLVAITWVFSVRCLLWLTDVNCGDTHTSSSSGKSGKRLPLIFFAILYCFSKVCCSPSYIRTPRSVSYKRAKFNNLG